MPKRKYPAGSPGGKGGEWMPDTPGIELNPAAKTLDLFRGWARSQIQRVTGKPGTPEQHAPLAHKYYFGDVLGHQMNSILRGNSGHHVTHREVMARYADQIEQEFSKSPFLLAAGQTLHRGVTPEFARQLTPGSQFTDAGFTSTSVHPRQATKQRGEIQSTIRTKITVMHPTRVLVHEREAEILLPRGTMFRVKHNDGKTIHLEAHPPETFRKGP